MRFAHFWTLRDCAGVEQWDPDAEPRRFQSGYGHSFVELYARLQRAGYEVTIGKQIPRGSATVVVCLEELSEWNRHGVPGKTLALCWRMLVRRVPLVVIRNDVHPHIRVPYFTSLELLPTLASVEDPARQRALPLLPQRALRRRDDSRPPRIETVGLKTYIQNVPDWLPELERLLSEQGVSVRHDTSDAEGHDWGDFVDLDSVLCSQPSTTLGDARRKPATKLINAWAAGVIPICEPHVAYIEIAQPEHDSLFAATPEGMVSSIMRVNADPALAARLLGSARLRGADFSPSRVLAQWADALSGVEPRRRLRVLTEMAVCLTQIFLGPRVSRRLLAALPR